MNFIKCNCQLQKPNISNTSYVDNNEELSVMYRPINFSIVSLVFLDGLWYSQCSTWSQDTSRWVRFWSAPKDRSICISTTIKDFSWKDTGHCASDQENLELPIFDMVTIIRATNSFCCTNKIGEGGFGSVYKGQLSSGKDIAVKRLSTSSKQGVDEFKNEVILIAKLQHRNLVRLLGCCIHGEERMLVYEYMPNGSLDSFIFGIEKKSKSFTWSTRLDIIVGIARGILYLHQDSRLRIIHRDLKASNVLLDSEMNPKISDFGLARAFGHDQSSTKTERVVGTYGYMSPEYAIDGLFSMKSDVFSFGVIILEIMSGKRNRMFHHSDHDFNLLGHAWNLWTEGRASELLDPMMEGSYPMSKVLRCIQIGLLCVQKCREDRPMMPSVFLMLVSDSAILPQPKQPGFYIERSSIETYDQSLLKSTPSINEMTMTCLAAR
ncbi:hypothetical protein ACSBR1_038091 [Camellia fascicularis]